MPTLYPVRVHTQRYTLIDLCRYISIETWHFLASPIICFSSTSQGEKVKGKVAQSCLTLCRAIDSTVHGILQARMLEWAVPFSRRSSPPRDRTQVSYIAGGFFTI